MFSVFEDVLHGILDLPFILVNLVIDSINGWIALVAAIGDGIIALLPSFPELPEVAGEWIGFVAYFMPIPEMVGVFGVFLGAWAVWWGYIIIMRKVGVTE